MTKTVALNDRILDALRGLIEHHSSSRCVAEQMGQAHNYVARILRGETKLRLDVLERILETLGIPYRFFMEMVLADRPNDDEASEMLRFCCGSAAAQQAFLGDIQPTVDVLLRMPLVDAPDYPSRRAELDRLDEQRKSNLEAAQDGLRALLFEMLTDPPVPVPRQMLEDLAIALATYGTVQRFAGRRGDSAHSFLQAFDVAARSGRPLGRGLAYRKASYLIRDFGHADASLRFLERARECFLHAGEHQLSLELFVDRAVFRANLGDDESAVNDYETALAVLPKENRWLQYAAWCGLSSSCERLGQLVRALAASERAEAFHDGGENLGLAFLVWNRANLAAAMGESLLAEQAYRRGVDLLARFSEPIDAALCALDLAAFLVDRGEPDAVKQLADEMMAWLPMFRGSRIADSVIVELIRCAKWGELTGRTLRSARERLERAKSA